MTATTAEQRKGIPEEGSSAHGDDRSKGPATGDACWVDLNAGGSVRDRVSDASLVSVLNGDVTTRPMGSGLLPPCLQEAHEPRFTGLNLIDERDRFLEARSGGKPTTFAQSPLPHHRRPYSSPTPSPSGHGVIVIVNDPKYDPRSKLIN
jgi:hypothetical protein